MPKLKIDGLDIEVAKGTKVIEAAERLGIVIPRFCWHPALGPAGACRVCAVMFLEGPIKGIQMSCMVEAQDGMAVSTAHPEAAAFRKQVVEWLMMNHPHDCPVCDEGGQCLLQDMTVSGGHGMRRYRGKKRTYRDQDLGPFIQHEMNRCIHCYRCVRFYQGFSGYRDLGAMQSAHRTYFGRYQDGPLESPFSGNLADICPTGVYTDKTARFKGRRWDFERGPSLCIHCSLGCRTVGSARYREVVLMEAAFSEAVNGYFICDRGRFGFHYVNHSERPRRARLEKEEVSQEEAMEMSVRTLKKITEASGASSVASLASSRTSLENQAMLVRLSRRMGWKTPAFFPTRAVASKVSRAASSLDSRITVSLREIEEADFILVLGADPVNEAPMLALALRQASLRKGRVTILDPRPVFLPFDFAHLPLSPADMEIFFGALVKRAAGPSPSSRLGPKAIQFLDSLPGEFPEGVFKDRFADLESRLKESRRLIMICGLDLLPPSFLDLVAAGAAILRRAKGPAGLFYVMPGANSLGAALLEPASGSVEQVVEEIEVGKIRALIIVECDPFWLFPHRQRLAKALARLDFLMAMDFLPSKIGDSAQVFFPTATLFEAESSFVNQEGRLQSARSFYSGGSPVIQAGAGNHPPRTFQPEIPGGEPQPAWRILAGLEKDLAVPGNGSFQPTLLDLREWMVKEFSALAHVDSFGSPEGIRLLQERKDGDFFPPRENATPANPAGESLDLFFVDWTFGTEELSCYSPFTRRAEKNPCLFLHVADAARLRLADKDRVHIALDNGSLEVEVSVVENMAKGVMILPRHRQLAWQVSREMPVRVPIDKIKKVVSSSEFKVSS
jgi:NADH-quinone oxidoreductase subunit G